MIKIDWKKFMMKKGIFGYYLWCDKWYTDMDDGYAEIQVEDWSIIRHDSEQGWRKVWKFKSDWSLD